MRREGFELTVGKPQVVTREIDGKLHEPMERVAIDVPDDYLGVVTQLMALRKGTLIEMVNHGTGWVRMDYRVPARGLVGFRTEFMTETRGTGMLHHVFDGWEPWHGELKTKRNGSMVADRRGMTTGYTLMSLQERGILLVGPGTEVYEGMVVGENARDEEMDVNPTQGEEADQRARSASADEAIRLTPPLAALPRAGARVHLRRRVRRGDPRSRSGCARSCSTRPPAAANGAGPSPAAPDRRSPADRVRRPTKNSWLSPSRPQRLAQDGSAACR